MKKKLAIIANGWNYDSLSEALKGIQEYAAKEDFDTFVFMSFASYSEHHDLVQGELNMYELMTPTDYDGIIVFSTAINSEPTARKICQNALDSGVPVVSIGLEIDGVHCISVSNKEGMRELVTHLVDKHDVKRVFFIGGTIDHVDSIARLEATREVLEEHGLTLDENDIKYGKWSNRYTCEIIDEIVESDKGLPDAIVCANDIMAMAACTELESKGFLAPQDVIVTGFDDAADGKIFYPALSSVAQNYKEIGSCACEIIFNEIDGAKDVVRKVVRSGFTCGESCRCKGDRDYNADRIAYCRRSFKRKSDAKLLEQNERVMRQWLAEMPNYNVLKETLSNHYQRNHQFEGNGFYICINEFYFKDVNLSEKDLWAKGSKAGIDVLVALKNGEIVSDAMVNLRSIVPDYVKNPGEQHVYFLLPMHYFENNYGYVVFTDFPYIISEDMLYPYMEKLQQSIRFMRINLRLKNLYDKDQMTGLFNRFGYENKAVPLYKESIEKGSPVLIMFVDINYMKRINDEYGHIHGDYAIKSVVESINKSIDDDAIAVRFGGDEFLIIAPGYSLERAAETKQCILDELEDHNETNGFPYNVTVSIGYVVSDPVGRRDASLQDYIKEADREMYEIKKEMHMMNDRRKR